MRTLRRHARPSASWSAAPKARGSVGSSAKVSIGISHLLADPSREEGAALGHRLAGERGGDHRQHRRGHPAVEDDGRPGWTEPLVGAEHPDRAVDRVGRGSIGIEPLEATPDAEAATGLAVVAVAGDHPDRDVPRRLAAGGRDAGGRDASAISTEVSP